jgi:predicted O-linked N-acetylglucosamine transferase (SPINDLY family)
MNEAGSRSIADALSQANSILQRGDPGAAAAAYQQVLVRDPGNADALLNMGAACMALGKFEDAMRSFDRALQIKPKWGLAWTNRGNALLSLKKPEEALVSYGTAIECDPADPRAHCNIGNALRDLGRLDQALLSYQRALELKPDYPLALRNCASLLNALKRPAEALTCYERALQLAPRDTAALVACGNLLLALSRPREAVAQFERALEVEGNHLEALNNRGVAQLQLGDAAAALASFDRLVAIAPRTPGFLSNRGEALLRLNRCAEAAETYARLLDLAPDFDLAPGKLLSARLSICEWSSFEHLRSQVERLVSEGRRACAPFEFLAVSDSGAAQLRCAQRYCAKLGAAAGPDAGPRAARDGGRRIRVAYVSGDFGNRPVTHLLVGVLEQHNRAAFETLGISLRPPDTSDAGQRVARSFERFIDVSDRSDRGVSELMKDLGVDIAIDLMGHTHGARPAIFRDRAAPIQAGYLGFPGSCGSAWLDYIIADEYVIPEESRCNFAEQVIHLPECFQANDGQRRIGPPPSRAQMGLPQEGFVFCSFNNSYKLNPAMFEVWCRLLNARPDSVLWLIADQPEVEANLRREAMRRGVAASRIVFAKRAPYQEHLARQVAADLFLDTLPFNAGTTASDALWAGLPVLTCSGDAFAARMAGSLLRTAGLPQLITHSLDEYERRALDLSGRGSELGELRARLQTESRRGPLFDTPRFSRFLEAAYQEMCKRHSLGLGPASFKVRDAPMSAP